MPCTVSFFIGSSWKLEPLPRSPYHACSVIFFNHSYSATEYEVEVSHNDEMFIINGEKYEAKTYCFNLYEGDKVIFLSGSPLGACASAEILNVKTKKKCRLWCE